MGERKHHLRELQALWYRRLAKEGFLDIEDTRLDARPLKEWHSFSFIHERSQVRKQMDSDYQEKIESLLHHEDWTEICELVIKHPNSKRFLSETKASLIWELHTQGLTERKIAEKVQYSKTGVHKVIERFRAWMTLIT